jgi:hypothetical protein
MVSFLLLLYRRCGHGIHHSESPEQASQFCGHSKKNPRRGSRQADLASSIVATARRTLPNSNRARPAPRVSPFLRFGSIFGPFRRIFAGEREHRPRLLAKVGLRRGGIHALESARALFDDDNRRPTRGTRRYPLYTHLRMGPILGSKA